MLAVIVFTLLITINAVADNCKEAGLYCAIPKQTRKVNGVDIHRDCWHYKYKMDCNSKSKNDCGSIPFAQCALIKEECGAQVKEGNLEFCANLIRHFSCEKEVKYMDEKTTLEKNGEALNSKDLLCKAMCIDGNCDAVKKAAPESNDELAKSVGMLNAVADIKKGLSGDKIINIFKGDRKECKYDVLNFRNCCRGSPKGWGVKLSKCSPGELNLAKLRNQKQCVEIGVYCKTKIPITEICIDKRKVFCCYDSVISRILNQEAKKQLGLDYGVPEDPQCGGIELADLEKIDFTQADFSDFYNEVVIPNIKIPDLKSDATQIQAKAEDIKSSAPNLPDERKGFNEDALKRLPE